MTTADRNDLMPAEEKLEWVTPKISLMGAGGTAAGKVYASSELGLTPCLGANGGKGCVRGPS